MQGVCIISYQAALEGLEALRLFRLQNARVNSQRGEQVEAVVSREKRDIETLQVTARGAHHQTAITGFLGLSRTFPSPCMYPAL